MKRRSFVGTITGVVVMMVFALVAMTAAFDLVNHDSRSAKSEFMTSRLKLGGISFYYPGQGKEANYYQIELRNTNVSAHTSDISSFLRDPVGRLRQQGIAVPPASERHWQALTAALRRLSNRRIPASSTAGGPKDNPNLKNEIVRLQIPGGWISVAGDLDGGGKSFLADSVGYLRTQGVNVPSADEPAWRQLAAALKALRLEYANSRVNGSNPQIPVDPGKMNFEYLGRPWAVDPRGGDAAKTTYGTKEKTVNIQISISASDRQQFLKDPVNTLLGRGLAVPRPAETHWREFTSALQKLAGPELAKPVVRKKPGRTTFANIVLERGYTPGVTVTIVGDWNADGTNTSAAGTQNTNGWFISRPVVTLRAQGMNVPAGDERAWKQLADALRALQLAYAQPERKN